MFTRSSPYFGPERRQDTVRLSTRCRAGRRPERFRKPSSEAVADMKVEVTLLTHPDSIYAGAIGAAIRGAFRHDKLARLDRLARAS